MLSQAVRHAGQKRFDPAHTGSVTSSGTVTHASSKQVPEGQQLFALWRRSLGFPLPGFLLAALLSSSLLFPLGPRQLLGVCVCNLLFCCRWFVPGLWLLGLRLRRDEELDLLCADGDFIWLEPSFEMLQGALIGIKSIHKKL